MKVQIQYDLVLRGIRLMRWSVIVWGAAYLVLFNFAFIAIVINDQKPYHPILISIFVLIISSFAALVFVPSYKVYFYLEKLFRQAIESHDLPLLISQNYLKFRKFLFIQLLCNLFIDAYWTFNPSNEAEGIEAIVKVFGEASSEQVKIYFSLFDHLQNGFNWAIPLLDKSMPIYLLLLSYAFVKIYDANTKMKSELIEVI